MPNRWPISAASVPWSSAHWKSPATHSCVNAEAAAAISATVSKAKSWTLSAVNAGDMEPTEAGGNPLRGADSLWLGICTADFLLADFFPAVNLHAGAVLGYRLLRLFVHDDDADPPVDGIKRIAFVEHHRRGKPDHPQYLVFTHAAHNQFAARGVGPVSGKLPVAVALFAGRIRSGVGLTGQADPVWNLVQRLAD